MRAPIALLEVSAHKRILSALRSDLFDIEHTNICIVSNLEHIFSLGLINTFHLNAFSDYLMEKTYSTYQPGSLHV